MDSLIDVNRKPSHVPVKFHRYVCMCMEIEGVCRVPLAKYRLMNHCNKCIKPFRYYLRRCTSCREWFIKDFRIDTADCVRHTKCWSCLQEHGPCGDCIHDTIRFDFEPLGLNPKTYTTDELKDIFSFGSPF